MDIRGLGGLGGLGPLGNDNRRRDRVADPGRRRGEEHRAQPDVESLYLHIKSEGCVLSETVLDNIEIIVESGKIESRWGFVCAVSDSLGVASIDSIDGTGKKALNNALRLVEENSREYGLSIVGVVDQETVGRNVGEISDIVDQFPGHNRLLVLSHSRSRIEVYQGRDDGDTDRWQLAENHVRWSSENFTHQVELTDEHGAPIAMRLG